MARGTRVVTKKAVSAAERLRKTRHDAWVHASSGLGDPTRDKAAGILFLGDSTKSEQELGELYRFYDLARTIVSELTRDALRLEPCAEPADEDGDELDEGDQEAREKKKRAMKKELRRHGAWVKLAQARIWGRLYGLGAVCMAPERKAGPEQWAQPWAEDEKVKEIWVLSGPEMRPKTYYSDPFSEKFGQIATYWVTRAAIGAAASAPVEVHESRLITFGGADTPPEAKAQNIGRDDSVLVACYEALKQAGGNWASITSMIHDMSVAVYKLQDYIDSLSGEGKAAVAARKSAMDVERSTTRCVTLDKDGEEFEYKERGAATGMAELADKSWLRLAAAARMPVSRLLGQAPAGLNATGEGDADIWNSQVEAEQEQVIGPAAERLCNRLDPSVDWEVEFEALDPESDLEKEDRLNKRANTYKTLIDAGVYFEDEVAAAIGVEGNEFGVTVDLKVREEMLTNAHEQALNPPPPVAVGGAASAAQGAQDPAQPEGSGEQGAPGAQKPAGKVPAADE